MAMFSTLSDVYAHYGGVRAFLSSKYLWMSCVTALLCTFLGAGEAWIELALTSLPSLVGFSIASFAVFFAVLQPNQVNALLKPNKNGQSPLVRTLSIICHALVVQVCALIAAGVDNAIDELVVLSLVRLTFPEIHSLQSIWQILNFFGTWLLFYAWLLLPAGVLSIFRFLKSVSEANK